MVIAESSINILASKKKIEFLQPLKDAQKKVENVPPIKLSLRNKVCCFPFNFENSKVVFASLFATVLLKKQPLQYFSK